MSDQPKEMSFASINEMESLMVAKFETSTRGRGGEGSLIPPSNFEMVDRAIYHSGFYTTQNLEFLDALNLRSILYLCPEPYPEANAESVGSRGIQLFQFPIEGSKAPMISVASHFLQQDISQLKVAQSEGLVPKRRWAWHERKLTVSMESSTRSIEKQDSNSTSNHRILGTTIVHSDSPKVARSTSAPLVEALKSCAEQDVACFHFPGHNRGKAAPPSLSQLTSLKPFFHDLPELPELDDLFFPEGVILDAQKRAAELFGASETWFLVGGTTCGIQASIMATCSPGETLILPRNSHISATSGLVLSGAIPKYIMPEYSPEWDIAGGVTSSQVENALKDLEAVGKRAAAVLVTSPTYHGICSNVRDITKLCHSRGIPTIVDEAHGAHFGFHAGLPSSALHQGADLVVQSTHKVLSSLTQSSMLHSLGNLIDKERVRKCLQMLQSSSPSYLLLASLDAARAQLSENTDTIFGKAMDLAIGARHLISMIHGVSLLDLSSFMSDFPSMDLLRITLGVSRLGISGYMADDILCQERQVICELAGSRSLTFAINLGTCREDIQRLVLGMEHLSTTYYCGNELGNNFKDGVYEPFSDISFGLSPREAFFAKKRKVAIGECIGEICGELISSYPPGIPVLIPGEVITEKALSYLVDVKRMGAAISGAADRQLSSILVCNV